MEDADRLTPSLIARAALVCGAAVACLFLLSGTARADEGRDASGVSEVPDGRTAVGGLLSGTLGDAVDGTLGGATTAVGDTVDDATHHASDPAATVGQTVGDVKQTVRAVAEGPVGGVGQVVDDTTGAVDRVVDDVLGPGGGEPRTGLEPAAPAATPDPAAATPEQPPAGPVDRSRAADQAGSAQHREAAVRDREPVRPAPGRAGDGRVSRSGPAAVGAATVTSVPAPVDLGVAPATDPARAGSLAAGGPVLLGVACDDCAATTTTSGDSPHVLGLPSAGVSTPRTAAIVPRAVAVGGPTSVFDRPDVSPG